jgi:hypothetical protein
MVFIAAAKIQLVFQKFVVVGITNTLHSMLSVDKKCVYLSEPVNVLRKCMKTIVAGLCA